MDVESVRIVALSQPKFTHCASLMEALLVGRVRDSIALSDSSRFILKHSGIDDFHDINVPLGKQTMKLEFTDAKNPADVSTIWDERTVTATCPERKCARCIMDLAAADDRNITGAAVLRDMRISSQVALNKFL